MDIITDESIKRAIALTLNMFYPEIAIYKEVNKQVFDEACFFIVQLGVEQQPQGRSMFERTYQMEVRYYPFGDNKRSDCTMIGERLLSLLQLLRIGSGFIRGKAMSYKIEDEVLHVYVTYKLRVTEANDVERMQNLMIKGEVK